MQLCKDISKYNILVWCLRNCGLLVEESTDSVLWKYWVLTGNDKTKQLRGLSLWANYTDRVTVACQRS
jgi:hypothetical protein